MIAKDDNLLVKLVKKSVGLPTGNPSCGCSAPVTSTRECCKAEATEKGATGCGCVSASTTQGEKQAAQS